MQPKIRKAFFKTSKCYILYNSMYIVVHSLSHVWLFVTPWTAAHQAPLSLTVSWSLLKLMSIEPMIPSNHLILCFPPAFNLSQHQGLFKWVSSAHHVAKVLELQLQHQSFQWIFKTWGYSLRTDWLDLLTVQGTLKSLLQQYISKASILRCSAFFIVPTLTSLHDYWKNHSLDWMDLCWQSNASAF